MFNLNFERRYPLLVGDPDAFDIVLVGCGGTGSFLAQDLARLAYHARAQHIEVKLTFVDFDKVELKNVGRQNFSPIELGRYKAETLAMRFNQAFGLTIRHVNTPFHSDLLPRYNTRDFKLVVGAVDNAFARRDIATAIETRHGQVWWLDSGNLYAEGQIVLGNVADWSDATAFPGTGFCHQLPAPHLLRPGLLVPQPKKKVGVSCADLTLLDVQGLMTNRAMATFVSQYLYRLVITRTLDIFMTFVDLNSGNVSSLPITKSGISQELGVA